MKLVIALFLFFISGCATTANYEKIVSSWVGQSEDNLLISWGSPSKVYETPSGMRVLTYLNASGPISNTYYNAFSNSYQTYTTNYSCQTDFYVNQLKTITSWRFEGNSCKARAPSSN